MHKKALTVLALALATTLEGAAEPYGTLPEEFGFPGIRVGMNLDQVKVELTKRGLKYTPATANYGYFTIVERPSGRYRQLLVGQFEKELRVGLIESEPDKYGFQLREWKSEMRSRFGAPQSVAGTDKAGSEIFCHNPYVAAMVAWEDRQVMLQYGHHPSGIGICKLHASGRPGTAMLYSTFIPAQTLGLPTAQARQNPTTVATRSEAGSAQNTPGSVPSPVPSTPVSQPTDAEITAEQLEHYITLTRWSVGEHSVEAGSVKVTERTSGQIKGSYRTYVFGGDITERFTAIVYGDKVHCIKLSERPLTRTPTSCLQVPASKNDAHAKQQEIDKARARALHETMQGGQSGPRVTCTRTEVSHLGTLAFCECSDGSTRPAGNC